jgi:cytidine deaminase
MPTFTLTDTQQQALLQAALQAQGKAYAPYSNYPVGAAVLDEHGHIHAGCNVENAAYPEGLCAEAAALAAMVLAGGRQARAVLVVGGGSDGAWITPCGGCRQKLREFGAPDLIILSANTETLGPRHTLSQLLPESFGPGHIKAR